MILFMAVHSQASLSGFRTDISKCSIELSELTAGGPGKDGIPSIDKPKFIPVEKAGQWLKGKEPVIAVDIDQVAKAYPLHILIWHEIVNDAINHIPVVVTFCPLCYSAIFFKRHLEGTVLEFGVSGFLRHSDLIMYG
jgi:hypothetical protein